MLLAMARGFPSWALQVHFVLRVTSIGLLLTSLSFLIYCSVAFSTHLVAGYVVVQILSF